MPDDCITRHIRSLPERIGRLTRRNRLRFAALCCETMAPNYEAFTQWESRGDWQIVRGALDLVWDYINDLDDSLDQMIRMKEELLGVTPNPVMDLGGGSWLTGLATDAGLAIARAVDLCITDSTKIISDIAGGSLDSIDSYLMNVAEPLPIRGMPDFGMSEFVQSSPLMTAEIWRQDKSVESLSANEIVTDDVAQQLREAAIQSGVQPFRRGLV